MSHRRPPTAADRFIARLEKDHPTLPYEVTKPFPTMSEEAFVVLDEVHAQEGYCENESLEYRGDGERDDNALIAQEASLWSNWRVSRQVFRFDRTLSTELMRTPCPTNMPLDVMQRLPYPCLFVEAPYTDSGIGHGKHDIQGFFCWRDKIGIPGVTGESFDDCSRDCLTFLLLEDGRTCAYACVETQLRTLGEAVEHTIAMCEKSLNTFGLTRRWDEDDVDHLYRMLNYSLTHLLYIVANNSDQEVEYRPSGTTSRRRSERQSASTIHSVGVRVGRALGASHVRYVGDNRRKGNGGWSVAPHIRAGHWQRFWTGPLSDPSKRKVVVHWIAPIVVNAGKGDLSTVVHDTSVHTK